MIDIMTMEHREQAIMERVFQETTQLLTEDITEEDSARIHTLKSILYVAVERVGMRAEQLFYAQRLLRELMHVVTTRPCLNDHERHAALQILCDLKDRYQNSNKDP